MKLSTVSAALLSLVALATAAPVKFTAVHVDEPGPHHFRVGLAGAGTPHKNYITPKGGHPEVLDVEIIQILPMPADFDPKFTSPPFIPPGRLPHARPVADILPPIDGSYVTNHARPCHGSMSKSVAMSNWFRHVVGMPVIEPALAVDSVVVTDGPMLAHPHSHGHHRVYKHGHHGHHGHHGWMKNWRNRPFADRLTHALMSLGPWEGRFVAFVLGCGIGVLIRLAWVMTVLIVRSVRGSAHHDEEDDEDEITLTEEEQYLLPPPEYTDEKVAIIIVEEHHQPAN